MTIGQRIVWIVYALVIAVCAFAAIDRPQDTRNAVVSALAATLIAAVLHAVVRPAAASSPSASSPSRGGSSASPSPASRP